MLTKTAATESTIPVSEILSLRLYPDTRPHHCRSSNIQKGLVFIYKGAELIGEGTGFGVPATRYQDKTYFPGSATVQIFHTDGCTRITKRFVLNMIRELEFGKARIDSKIARKLLRHTDGLYEEHKHWRPILQQNLLGHFRVHTVFTRVKPVGEVTSIYHVDDSFVHVKANFKFLKKNGLQKIFLLNEQSSKHFNKYRDSKGTSLFHKQIGAWDKVEADWACLSSANGEFGFRLWKVKDTILRRGMEFLDDCLDWAGLDYETSPEKTSFEYDIEIFGGAKHQ